MAKAKAKVGDIEVEIEDDNLSGEEALKLVLQVIEVLIKLGRGGDDDGPDD